MCSKLYTNNLRQRRRSIRATTFSILTSSSKLYSQLITVSRIYTCVHRCYIHTYIYMFNCCIYLFTLFVSLVRDENYNTHLLLVISLQENNTRVRLFIYCLCGDGYLDIIYTRIYTSTLSSRALQSHLATRTKSHSIIF